MLPLWTHEMSSCLLQMYFVETSWAIALVLISQEALLIWRILNRWCSYQESCLFLSSVKPCLFLSSIALLVNNHKATVATAGNNILLTTTGLDLSSVKLLMCLVVIYSRGSIITTVACPLKPSNRIVAQIYVNQENDVFPQFLVKSRCQLWKDSPWSFTWMV